MFEFLIYPPPFTEAHRTNVVSNVPIHVAAQGMMLSAVDVTVKQFNEACEKVCYEKKSKASGGTSKKA